MPSLGKDLAIIRSHLGHTIEDIQQATKIPLSTLQSIEKGTIFSHSDEIKTYVRSFIRSYARILKLDDTVVVKALDQQEAGNYNHLLLKSFPELTPDLIQNVEEPAPPKSEDISSDADKASETFNDEPPIESTTPPPPGVRSVNWADMGKRFSSNKKQPSTWLIGVAVLIVLLVGTYAIYQMDFFSGSEEVRTAETVEPETSSPAQNDLNLPLELTEEPPQQVETAELDDVLELTLYAAYNSLGPVRVWSDEKPRMDPYWMDQGTAFNFEFQDTIRVRGQYSRMLLFMNGHRIDNFRDQLFNAAENSVEITRNLFENDPKWATPIPLELPDNATPPDSIAPRPTF